MGTIAVKESSIGGARFEMTLPIGTPLGWPQVAERGREVVIVDDDPSVRVAFERQIRLMGHQPKSFEDPTQALGAIRAGAGCCVTVDECMPSMWDCNSRTN